jgi:hypothetical protein
LTKIDKEKCVCLNKSIFSSLFPAELGKISWFDPRSEIALAVSTLNLSIVPKRWRRRTDGTVKISGLQKYP